ncbi:hypothetical protein ELH93_22300 [Rhizobium leguminosarum]|jgi:hypothetical protein|uniref:Uncharacterized protein n=1 Tax=Rhizobium leguminosarum TaxID=384 RepID=A0ABD7PYF9_RHILE|nr:hypothetical protein [Rhizobium leguminosarum]TAW32071.1 hypothetical protein ELI19_22300 [Rhizobium leguminosarum]TAW45802.1 hypothetical protein ELI18_22270 [Rhizobium leguminosarum]TAY35182.1 hypothetical protein ELH93_22300 [Rhizobium leguminosarum]
MQVVKISSEDEAWAMLDAAIKGQLPGPAEEPIVLDFDKWLKFAIHLPGTPVDGSITPTMMEAFVELQKSIYRTYMLISSETNDLRFLSNSQREKLEFRVEVREGSSDYSADFTAILEKMGLEALSKMDSKEVVITVLGLALIFASVYAFKSWLNYRTETREKEIDAEDKKEALAVARVAIEANSENTRILAAAIAARPILQDVEALVEPAREKLIQAVGHEGGGTLNGTVVSSSLAAELGSQKRQQSQEVLIKGNFRVVRVDTTSPEGFRVTLAGGPADQEITAALTEYLASTDHREAIRRAEWDKKPVYVEMTARKLRDRIIDATVTLASDVPDSLESTVVADPA